MDAQQAEAVVPVVAAAVAAAGLAAEAGVGVEAGVTVEAEVEAEVTQSGQMRPWRHAVEKKK